MSKKDIMQLSGIIAFVIGFIILISNIRVSGLWGFAGGKAGIILILIGIDFILIMVKKNKLSLVLMAVLIVLLILSVILNLRVYLMGMSLFKYLLITVLIFGGIGLIIKSKKD